MNEALVARARERDRQPSGEPPGRTDFPSFLGRLAAGVAREALHPLVVAKGCMDLALADEGLAADSRRALQVARGELDRGAGCLELLAALSPPPKPAPTDLNSLLSDTLERAADRLGSRSIEIRRQFGRLPAVEVSREPLLQTLLHLVLATMEATPEGGRLAVTTRLEAGRDGGEAIVVEVGTRGQDDRGRPPTERLRPPRADAVRGSKPMLSLCGEVLRNHGADLVVENREGSPPAYAIRLPVKAGWRA
jgi:signal transduction histidine kinase